MIKAKRIQTLPALGLLGLLTFSHWGYAQSKLEIGIRFAPQATSFRYQTPSPIQDFLKLTPHYFRVRTAQGLGVLYHPYKRWSVGADVLYSLQGGGYESRRTNVNYLKMPLWLGYNGSPDRRLIFNVQTGIAFAWLVSAKIKYADGEEIDIVRYANRTTWGVPLAVGLKYKILKTYYMNTQLFLYTDFESLSKTNPAFKVANYILPGIRFSIDQSVKK